MIVAHNEVTFESNDWNSGKAKRVIAWLKQNGGRYSPKTKRWRIKSEQELQTFLDSFKEKKVSPVEVMPMLKEPSEYTLYNIFELRGQLKEAKELLTELLENEDSKASLVERVENFIVEKERIYKQITKESHDTL